MSTKKDDGGPAFPCDYDMSGFVNTEKGMTLWDYFAAHALMTNVILSWRDPNSITMDGIVKDASNIADAMIEERKKRFEVKL